MAREPASDDASTTSEAKAYSSARAQTQPRPRRTKPGNSIHHKENNPLNSEEETGEDGTSDEEAVSPMRDPTMVREGMKLDSKNRFTHDESSPRRRPRLGSRKIRESEKYWEDILVHSREMARCTLLLVRNAFKLALPFLAALLALWLLIATVRHLIFPSIEASLAFGCRLPFTSGLRLCQNPPVFEIPKVNETMDTQSDYGEVLQFVHERQELPFNLLVSANKAADLQIDIAQSNLPSRDVLSDEFSRFDRDINAAARVFREFLAQVQSSGQALVDADMTMMQQLDSLNQASSLWAEGVKFLNIFSGYNPPTERALNIIFDEYLLLLDLSIDRIDDVYNITEKTLAGLETLRQDTLRIYAITRADEKRIKATKDEEERKWWKKKRVLEELHGQLQLLDNVDKHRNRAVDFVTEVRDKVENIKVALDELKRQAMTPRAQYKWGKVTEETLERHLRTWHTALRHQIVSLGQRLDAVAPGSPSRPAIH